MAHPQAQPDLTEGFPEEQQRPTPAITPSAPAPETETRPLTAEEAQALRDHIDDLQNQPPPPAPPKEPVELELALLVDASASVDDTEWSLQMDGYVRAFRDPEVQQLIAAQDGVAVFFLIWSSTLQQSTLSSRRLDTVEDVQRYADLLERIVRPFANNTVMANALGRAMREFRANQFEGERFVIDVSGDGVCENQAFHAANPVIAPEDEEHAQRLGPTWDQVLGSRDERFIINGISIGDVPGLNNWYTDTLIQGPGSFSLHAATFEEFADGIRAKLLREVADDAAPAEASLPFAYD